MEPPNYNLNIETEKPPSKKIRNGSFSTPAACVVISDSRVHFDEQRKDQVFVAHFFQTGRTRAEETRFGNDN